MSVLTKEQITEYLKIRYERIAMDLESLNRNLKNLKERDEYNRIDESVGLDTFSGYENTAGILSCEKEISDMKIKLQKIETYYRENNYDLPSEMTSKTCFH
jgi:hypothetical protein